MHWGDETSINSTVYLSIFCKARDKISLLELIVWLFQYHLHRNSDMRFGGVFFPNLFKHMRMTLSVKCLFKSRLPPFYNYGNCSWFASTAWQDEQYVTDLNKTPVLPLNLIVITWSCDTCRSECMTFTIYTAIRKWNNHCLKVVWNYKNCLVLKTLSIGEAMDLFWRCSFIIFSSTIYFEGTIFTILFIK